MDTSFDEPPFVASITKDQSLGIMPLLTAYIIIIYSLFVYKSTHVLEEYSNCVT